eukprot:6174938-Pleurochrysis_carterae.AAC.2
MGALCCCLPKEEVSSNPMLDQEARMRAALAAESRLRSFENSAQGRAAKKVAQAHARQNIDARRGGGGGEPALRWQEA